MKSKMLRIAKAMGRHVAPKTYDRLGSWRFRARLARLDWIAQTIAHEQGLVVQSGPFAGMAYIPLAFGSVLVPKLVGCYEAELHDSIQQVIARHCGRIVNIGCGEGYYAVGLALRLPEAQVYAFDADVTARRLCGDLALLNGVHDRVVIADACDTDALTAVVGDDSFVLCDCEGCELEVLRPDRVDGLDQSIVLVELHGFVDPDIAAKIHARFAVTHDITYVASVERDPAKYPSLSRFSQADRYLAVSELRSMSMEWALMVPRSAPRE